MTTEDYYNREFRDMAEQTSEIGRHIRDTQRRISGIVDDIQSLGYEWSEQERRFNPDGLHTLSRVSDRIADLETEKAKLIDLYELDVRLRQLVERRDPWWNYDEPENS